MSSLIGSPTTSRETPPASPGPGAPGSPSGGSRFNLGGLLRSRSNNLKSTNLPSPGLSSSNSIVELPSSPGEGSGTERGASYFPALRRRRSRPNVQSPAQLAPQASDDGSRSRSRALSHPVPSVPPSPSSTSVQTSARPTTADHQRTALGLTLGIASASGPLTPSEDLPDLTASSSSPKSSVIKLRLVPHLDHSTRSLHFDPISREIPKTAPVRIGRLNERTPSNALNAPNHRIAFKSKVVSRSHAELWTDDTARLFVRDTKSSSGTFLNHIRLSGPGQESRPFIVNDGDILQLGVDYQGGTQDMYRCVKMRVEINRTTVIGANAFNVNTLRQLRALGGGSHSKLKGAERPSKHSAAAPPDASVSDCCICLFAVTVCQALFIAPCSHVYHYKCIRPLLQMHHPGFSCPLCRTFADLEADVETEFEIGTVGVDAVSAEDDVEDGTLAASAMANAVTFTGLVDLASPSESNAEPSPAPLVGNRRPSALSLGPGRPPHAGEFEREIRRSSIVVSGSSGNVFPLSFSGRSSRPPSINSRPESVHTAQLARSDTSEEVLASNRDAESGEGAEMSEIGHSFPAPSIASTPAATTPDGEDTRAEERVRGSSTEGSTSSSLVKSLDPKPEAPV